MSPVNGETLAREWRRRKVASQELKETRTRLEFQRRKIRQLLEELDEAECLERELESRLTTEKNRAKPPLMQFVEKMSDPAGVDLAIVQKVVEEVQRTDQIMRCLRKEARGLARMDRSHLLGFLNTLVRLKTCFLERDMEDGVQGVQEIIRKGLRQLSFVECLNMTDTEVEITRELLRESTDLPAFMPRLLAQLAQSPGV